MRAETPSTDEQLVRAELQQAATEQRPPSDVAVRIIASWWHCGMATALYAFTSSGAIEPDLAYEIKQNQGEPDVDDFDRSCLGALAVYVADKGERPPVEGWHQSTRWGSES